MLRPSRFAAFLQHWSGRRDHEAACFITQCVQVVWLCLRDITLQGRCLMCGIAGIIGNVDDAQLRLMTQMLYHRGPDDGAVWTGPGAGLGHRRLSILDLSAAGRQPMVSPDGRYVLVYNGEIFNYPELRAQLEGRGHVFRSRTDSEAVLYACLEWGEEAVLRLVGQFAFGFWDTHERSLLLARDHLGVKPLYLSVQDDGLYFASEAKAIVAALPCTRRPRADLLPQYLSFLWIPGTDTMFDGIDRLAPGSLAVFRNGALRTRRYWDPIEKFREAGPAQPSPRQRDEEFRDLLRGAVQSQLASDVPLGLLLSGGVDSTVLLKEMTDAGRDVRAFTATYSSASRGRDVFDDDLPFARMAAQDAGADLEVAELEADVPKLLPEAVWHLDEPLADPTVVTNLALTRRAKQRLTVLLTGMGADEILAGYPRYPAVLFGERLRFMPPVFAHMLAGLLHSAVRVGFLPIERGRRPLYLLRHLSRPFVDRFLGYSTYNSPSDLQRLLSGDMQERMTLEHIQEIHRELFARTAGMTPLSRMLAVDLCTFLPQLNLENMDKTGMANAVELRVPFLDHRLVEYSMALPDDDKLRSSKRRKVLLRRAYRDRIPDPILRRPKTGYSPPVRGWMRDSLREYTEDILLSRTAAERGLFERGRIDQLLRENGDGREDHSMRLWQLLVLETWFREYLDGSLHAPAADPAALPDVSHKHGSMS